jgi:hypothetical protein
MMKTRPHASVDFVDVIVDAMNSIDVFQLL